VKSILIKKRNSFKVFQNGENNFLYDGSIGVLLQISKIIFDMIKLSSFFDVENEYESMIEHLTKTYKYSDVKKELNEFVSVYEKNKLVNKNIVYDTYDRIYNLPEESSYNGGLWLNLSHACNLNCTYCYADHGKYGGESTLMSTDIAQECIDFWFSKIDKSKKEFDIVFFGGEPLVNKRAFFYAINEINKKLSSIDARPKYLMTTNGTILDEDIMNALKENYFDLTVSIDGLEFIHNANRSYLSGKDSYNDVEENLKKMLEFKPKVAVNMVVKRNDIPFLKDSVFSIWNLGVKFVNVALSIDKDEKLDYENLSLYESQMNELSEITRKNIINGSYYVLDNIIESITNIKYKKNNANCSLYTNGVFVFDPHGDIYKCHKVVGDKKYKIANIDDKNAKIFATRKKKTSIKECSNCWVQALCNDGCPVEHKLFTNDENIVAEEFCRKTKIGENAGIKTYISLIMNNPKEMELFFKWRWN